MPVDSHISECQIKQIVANSRNSLFVDSPRGGHTAALLFDFDPSRLESADMATVVRELHSVLQEEGHSAFLTTSGKRGLHDWRQPVSRPWAAEIGSGPTLEQIQTLASLTTLKINVADALVTQLAGRTGGIRAVLVVHGNVTLGVDLSKARFESVDQRNRTAVLVRRAAGANQKKGALRASAITLLP